MLCVKELTDSEQDLLQTMSWQTNDHVLGGSFDSATCGETIKTKNVPTVARLSTCLHENKE